MRAGLEVLVGLLTAMCVLPYIRDTLAGRTKPQRMSWLVFASVSTTAFLAQVLDEGWTSGSMLALGAAVGFSSVAVLGIRHGVGGTSRVDAVCGVALIAVLALWPIIDDELVIVILVIAIEAVAVGATARKSWLAPRSETLSTWVIDGTAGVLAVLLVAERTFALLAYPVYHAAANATVATVVVVRRSAMPMTANDVRGER